MMDKDKGLKQAAADIMDDGMVEMLDDPENVLLLIDTEANEIEVLTLICQYLEDKSIAVLTDSSGIVDKYAQHIYPSLFDESSGQSAQGRVRFVELQDFIHERKDRRVDVAVLDFRLLDRAEYDDAFEILESRCGRIIGIMHEHAIEQQHEFVKPMAASSAATQLH